MGDFNAQIGSDNTGWEESMGREATGDRTAIKDCSTTAAPTN